MENDVLKNEIAPWQEKGRWYHAVFDVPTKTFIPELSDEYMTNSNFHFTAYSGALVILPADEKKIIMDYKMIPIDRVTSTGLWYQYYRIQTSMDIPKMGLSFIAEDYAGRIELFLFITDIN